MNKNYLRGRRLEYEVVEELRKFNPEGFAQRMAGSRSPFDVIGYNPTQKRIILVQCKTKLTDSEPLKGTIGTSELNISNGWEITTYKRTKYITRRKS